MKLSKLIRLHRKKRAVMILRDYMSQHLREEAENGCESGEGRGVDVIYIRIRPIGNTDGTAIAIDFNPMKNKPADAIMGEGWTERFTHELSEAVSSSYIVRDVFAQRGKELADRIREGERNVD